jgi:type IV pilus assembly protein PilC
MAGTTTFKYSVRDRSGKLVNGELAAETEAALVQRLKSMGYAPVSVEVANAGLQKELTIPGFGNKVKLKDLAIFSRQFATMINSGLSLMRSLSILSEQTESKELGRVIARFATRSKQAQRSRCRWASTPRSSRRSW